MKSLLGHPQWLWLDAYARRKFEMVCNLQLVGAVTFRDRRQGISWTVGVAADGDLVVRQGALTTPVIPHYVASALQTRARLVRRKAALLLRIGKAP